MRVAAIIAAAGSGTRAGGPKLALRLGENSFLGRICRSLCLTSVDEIVVVVQPPFALWAQAECPQARVVVNASPELGMLSSLVLGAGKAAESAGGLLVVPVDHPLVQPETYESLLRTFRETPDAMVFPKHAGRSGHPVLVPASLLQGTISPDQEGGLQALIRASGIRRMAVPVDDAGILRNVNYPQDLP